jgi:hypothetical protein
MSISRLVVDTTGTIDNLQWRFSLRNADDEELLFETEPDQGKVEDKIHELQGRYNIEEDEIVRLDEDLW